MVSLSEILRNIKSYIKNSGRTLYVYEEDDEGNELRKQIIIFGTGDPMREMSPFCQLQDSQYQNYCSLIEQALDLAPNEPLVWFLRGWGFQFLSDSSPMAPHPLFELIERNYSAFAREGEIW